MSTDLVVFEQFEQDIVTFEEVNAELTFEIETEEGEKECKKYLAKLRKVRNRIEKLRKDTKKEFLDKGRAVDAEAKSFMERIDAMHDIHDAPIRALEQARLDAEIDKREKEQAELKAAEEKREADLKEREEKAQAIIDQAAKVEAERVAERQAIERKEELEAAALLAAENATLKAAQDAIEAEAKAKQAVIDAVAETERKAQVEADRLAKEVSDKYAAQQAEQDTIDAGILARQQDEDHRRQYNNLALDAINAKIDDPQTSLRLVKAIVNGEIPNISMNY